MLAFTQERVKSQTAATLKTAATFKATVPLKTAAPFRATAPLRTAATLRATAPLRMGLLLHIPPLLLILPLAFCGLGASCGGQVTSAEHDDAAPTNTQVHGDDEGGKGDAVDTPACSFQPADNLSWTQVKHSAIPVGAFQVLWKTEGSLVVTHHVSPDKVRFASVQDSFLEAAVARLDVTEHQGSFRLEEAVTTRCSRAEVESQAVQGRVTWFKGHFRDTMDQCQGLSFTVGFCEAQPGHLSFDIRLSDPAFRRITLRVASEAHERIYGMGEQFLRTTLNLKGRRIPVLVQEGGVGRGREPITSAVNLASPGSAGDETSTYYAAPQYFTSTGQSLFLENEEVSFFDFRQDTETRISVYAPSVRGRILQGETPLELVERFTEYAGRMPELPAWIHEGAILALAQDVHSSLAIVNQLQAHGAHIAAVWNQTWPGKATTYIGEQVLWNWAYNPYYHPDWQSYVATLAEQGMRTLCYVNPMFRDPAAAGTQVTRNLFDEGIREGYFVRNAAGEVYKLPVTAFEVVLLDLSNSEARRWMKDVITEEMIRKAGCRGWMADFGEALPFDAIMSNGFTGEQYHNTYAIEWMRLNREVVEENGLLGEQLIFNRSGSTRTPRYSLLLWEGDQLVTWDEYDGLRSALHGLVSSGFSGIALNHSDTGGYTSLSKWGYGFTREPELLQRWVEMNAFTAVLRTHEGNQPDANAQVYSNETLMAHFARFTKVYRALGFYRRQLAKEAHEKGWPMVRHLLFHYPEDPRAWEQDDEFLLGADLLVAPVLSKCTTRPSCTSEVSVYLPRGRWVHLWTGKTYGSTAQAQQIKMQAPMGYPAVFYREGSSTGQTLVRTLTEEGLL